jgi:hypothetical protein
MTDAEELGRAGQFHWSSVASRGCRDDSHCTNAAEWSSSKSDSVALSGSASNVCTVATPDDLYPTTIYALGGG